MVSNLAACLNLSSNVSIDKSMKRKLLQKEITKN